MTNVRFHTEEEMDKHQLYLNKLISQISMLCSKKTRVKFETLIKAMNEYPCSPDEPFPENVANAYKECVEAFRHEINAATVRPKGRIERQILKILQL